MAILPLTYFTANLEEAVLNRTLKTANPLKCQCKSVSGKEDCGGWRCETCNLETPWCYGADDNFFADCDFCVALKKRNATRRRKAEGLPDDCDVTVEEGDLSLIPVSCDEKAHIKSEGG